MSRIRTTRTITLGAFTLIELLVVIAIIAILAALIFPAAGGIKRRATITKVQTEMKQVTTALDFYKEKLGFYPPDNPSPIDPPHYGVLNQLYYELSGTELTGNPPVYKTLDGSEQIVATTLTSAFGPNVAGFVNCSKGAGGDEAAAAKSFLLALKPGQFGLTTNGGVRLKLLTCSVPWPNNQSFQPVPTNPGLNPWRYVSSNATNNPGAYDLWADVLIAGKTYRIGNWSQQAQVVPTP